MSYQLIELEDVKIGYQKIDCKEHSHHIEHDAAYELLDDMLMKFYGIALDQQVIEKGAHGKPYFKDSFVEFNVSHCRGMVACVISDAAVVGIDVENVRGIRANVIERIFAKEEKQSIALADSQDKKEELFFRYWTYKESVVKMTGDGISKELHDVSYMEQKNPCYQEVLCEADEKYILTVSYRKK